jgi:hypothetical protein
MIFFNAEKVRNFLIKKGYVHTLRNKHLRSNDVAVYGSYRSWKRIGNVKIEFKNVITSADQLAPYVQESGFDSAEECFKTAQKISKGKYSQHFMLYLVTLTD